MKALRVRKITKIISNENMFIQECIPVGCVSPALYRTRGSLSGGGLLPVDRMTDPCGNITLSQTSFGSGKYEGK